MRVSCVSINYKTGDVNEKEFTCSQTSKDTIKNIIEKKLVEFLGYEHGPYNVKATAHHVCAIGGGVTGFACPIKTTTKLSDSLRVYDKDWTEVDAHLSAMPVSEMTTNEILAEMRKKYPDFTLTNIYYRLRTLGLEYKKSPRGKKSKYSL